MRSLVEKYILNRGL